MSFCVTEKDESSGIVQVEEFSTLKVSQDGNTDYNFIKNSMYNPEITTPVCSSGTDANDRSVCIATIIALPRFFDAKDPADLTITGSVFVVRDSGRVRRNLRMALPAPEKESEDNVLAVASRRAQTEDGEGGGDFEVIVALASAADSAASDTMTGTAAGLVSMAVGVLGNALMA